MPISKFTPIKNVVIASSHPKKNFSNQDEGTVLLVGSYTSQADTFRSLLQFNLSDPNHGIPHNCTIKSASLVLRLCRNDNPGVAQVEVMRLANVFEQETVTFTTAPTTIRVPIATPGDESDIKDPIVIPEDESSIVSVDVGNLVRGWYDGSIPNNGIELRGLENAENNILGFRSTRFINSNFWPTLQVTWAKGSLSPTIFDELSGFPTSSTLLDVAGYEHATFIIDNLTDGNLQGNVVLQNSGYNSVSDLSTVFSVPAGQQQVIHYSAAVDFLQLRFTSAGAGSYSVQSKARDE